MRSLTLLLAAAVAALPGTAYAAELTNVLDSFADEADPFDLTLGLSFVQQAQRATITKEYQEGNGTTGAAVVDAKELAYEEVRRSLEVTARMGISRDLELSVVLPVVLSWDVSWGLAAGTSAGQSVISSNDFGAGVCPRPLPSGINDSGWTYDESSNSCTPASITAAAGAVPLEGNRLYAPLFPVDGKARFSGLADPRFGLTWGMLDQTEDPSVPTWVLGVEYTAPVAAVRDPITASQQASTGGTGSGFHVLTFSTGLSRRMKHAEPYAQLRYALSLASGKAFDACQHPETLATPENCSAFAYPGATVGSSWSPSETRARPAHVGTIVFGSELDFLARGGPQRLFADVGGLVEYHSEGRDYTQATFMLQRLTYQEEFARVGARLGLGYAPSEVVTFTLGGSYSLDTAHVLTSERIGVDLDSDNQVGLDNKGQEINPNFDFRYDMPGRRLRATQISGWSLSIGSAVNF